MGSKDIVKVLIEITIGSLIKIFSGFKLGYLGLGLTQVLYNWVGADKDSTWLGPSESSQIWLSFKILFIIQFIISIHFASQFPYLGSSERGFLILPFIYPIF